MGLDRSKYSTDQQHEIEHCVREAMEVSRINALKEASAIAKQVYATNGHRGKGAYKAFHQACTRISVKLELARRKGMPYDPFPVKGGR